MRRTLWAVLVPIAVASLATTASATTLVRRGLERLTLDNETIVEASVLDIHSYWNTDHTFIFTDVHARPSRVLKGHPAADMTFTIMGGTVGETTTLIVGGPDLVPGSDYVLFLGRSDLPGAPDRLTIRDLCQGVFAVRRGRAFSQAIGEPLVPDEQGSADVPGGDGGLALEILSRRVLELR